MPNEFPLIETASGWFVGDDDRDREYELAMREMDEDREERLYGWR
jgi:hypothetical protein